MGLFEEAGVILGPGEKIVKRGSFTGQVPKGVEVSRSLWTHAPRPKVAWALVFHDGELVLTNQRLIVLALQHARINIFPDLRFRDFSAVKEIDKNTLLLSLNLGTGRLEETRLRVDNASEWVEAIKLQCGTDISDKSKEYAR